MQKPEQEITPIVSLIITATSPTIQRETILKYFTPEAGFRHPLCRVEPGPLSREDIIGIYQWYRIMSPEIDFQVKSVLFDRQQNMLILNVIQHFHIRYSPFSPAPSELMIRLSLKKEDNLYFIDSQEDFYQPDDLVVLVAPPIATGVRMLLCAGTIVSNLAAKTAQVFGFWLPDSANRLNTTNKHPKLKKRLPQGRHENGNGRDASNGHGVTNGNGNGNGNSNGKGNGNGNGKHE